MYFDSKYLFFDKLIMGNLYSFLFSGLVVSYSYHPDIANRCNLTDGET